ncbi:hypothetical protein H4S02_010414, partial [Coemansia sp. RSA 2611]
RKRSTSRWPCTQCPARRSTKATRSRGGSIGTRHPKASSAEPGRSKSQMLRLLPARS